MATIQERQQAAETPRPTRSREDGIAKILGPAEESREGARIAIFGRTRYGKSSFAVHLLDAMVARDIARTVIIHDVKYPDRQQYNGTPANSKDELRVALQTSSVVVCRPNGGGFPAADAAAVTRECVEQTGEPTVLLIDETRRALGLNQRFCDNTLPDGKPGPKNFEWLCLEAGGLRGSLVMLVQIPRQLPIDILDSAQYKVVFGVGGGSLDFLIDKRIVAREAAETVMSLPKGAFCIFTDDENWDREIYYSPLAG